MSKHPHRRKRRRLSAAHHRPGTAPGTLVQHADAPAVRVHVMAYGPTDLVDHDVTDLAELPGLIATHDVTWIDVTGVGDVATITRLGELLSLHRLALEDVQNVQQRTKVEAYATSTYVVLHMVEWTGEIAMEQLSLFLGDRWVLTFQEQEGDSFDPVRQRLHEARVRLRNSGADYLAYALMDAVIDHYFPTLDHVANAVEGLEDEVLDASPGDVVARIQRVRRDLIALRRAIWPLREVMASLHRDPGVLIGEETRLYLRDCHDHAVQVIDLVEACRERAAMVMELHLAAVSQRMNEVMKVLTIIATIFIPLSFVAGVYGMNFDSSASRWNMPELHWAFGYPAALGLMAVMAGGLLVYFKRKGWLGGGRTERRDGPDRRDSPDRG